MIAITCPKCRRWLAEVESGGRAVCRECGISVTVESRKQREPIGS